MASSVGYGSAWRKIRAAVLERDPVCVLCNAAPSLVADHKKSRASGGADDLSNLRGLCRPCHSRKTAEEDGAFGRYYAPDGIPLNRIKRRALARVNLSAVRAAKLRRDGCTFEYGVKSVGRLGPHCTLVRLVVYCVREDGSRVPLWPGKGRVKCTTFELGKWVRDYKGWDSKPTDRLLSDAATLVTRLNSVRYAGDRLRPPRPQAGANVSPQTLDMQEVVERVKFLPFASLGANATCAAEKTCVETMSRPLNA